jgi:hypothetical protein
MTFKTLKIVRIFFIFCLILFSTTFAFGAVQKFSQYDTKIKINSDDTLDVSKDISLQNTHIVGIVPGRVEFKIGKKIEGSSSNINLDSYTIKDRYGKDIKSQLFETDDEAVIAIDIFMPLLPGFKYLIDLDYTLSYDSSGLLFKSLEFPIKEDSSIELDTGTFTLELPESKSFTYIRAENTNISINENIATWDITEQSPLTGVVEYSSVPIYFGGVKGSFMFWISINVILLVILGIEIFRGIARMKREEKHHK